MEANNENKVVEIKTTCSEIKMNQRELAVVSAYTCMIVCDFSVFVNYCSELLSESVDMAQVSIRYKLIKEASKKDYFSLIKKYNLPEDISLPLLVKITKNSIK